MEKYVDLGLPSGTMWKSSNEENPTDTTYNFFTYDKAMAHFGYKLPSQVQWKELINECEWLWTGRGYKVVGLNKESIFLPAEGNRFPRGGVYDVGESGSYWSSTRCGLECAWSFCFDLGYIDLLDYDLRFGYSVRLINNQDCYVDLGLPSGTKWKTSNEMGFLTYDRAISKYGDELPSKKQFEELMSVCTWSWLGKGYKITGRNGNSIFMPAAGFRCPDGVVIGIGEMGNYWSSTPNGPESAWNLGFSAHNNLKNGINHNDNEEYIDIFKNNSRYSGISVRLIRK